MWHCLPASFYDRHDEIPSSSGIAEPASEQASSLSTLLGTSAAGPATPLCCATAGGGACGSRLGIGPTPLLARPRTPAAKPTPPAIPTPPDRFVRARLRCSSRASLPLTPQAGTPTATIGMRPATSLRTKAKSVELTPSGCRASWVLLRVQRCPRPYRPENALSMKECERAFSGR